MLGALVAVERGGVHAFWMFKQLAHLIRGIIDDGVDPPGTPAPPRPALVVEAAAADCASVEKPARKQWRLSNLALAVRAWVPGDVRQCLWKYLRAVRQKYHDNLVAGLGFDASRVGGKGFFLGLWSLPDGHGA